MKPADNYYQFSRPEVAKFIEKPYKKILEVGCGEGQFRSHFVDENEYWGVELNPDAVNVAQTRLDRVLKGDYFSVCDQIPNQFFDKIICNDVIEHIDNYIGFLDSLQDKLTPDGELICSIPNVRFLPNLWNLLVKADWKYVESGILDHTHLRFFTKKSIINFFENNGWEISSIQGINRYGNRALSPKKIISYIAQPVLGFDTAYLQFAVRASVKKS